MQKMKATKSDLIEASINLSANDLSDFDSMLGGRNPLDVFPKALDDTTHVIKSNGKVLAVGGHGGGGIWFVTTGVVSRLSKPERYKFYRILREHLAWVRHDAGSNKALTNFVALGNVLHVRLLEKLGAKFQAGHVMSPAGFPFKQFWL